MTLEDRVHDLECRLTDYHERLEEAVVERDRLAIDAAWGVHSDLHSTVVAFLLFYLFDRFVGWSNWLAIMGLGIAVFAAQMYARIKSNDARMAEVERFAMLPTWRRPDNGS
jgi:F0F1-type ATP synthase assembly protein I